ncbi:hypothetical protein ACES2L_05890 [Bdellovibrio bacteriovorus]|uniref:MtN3 and saliva related transmembrane protein n=1 Tax=Bdellovibrio reynosensis TaxID=2835041 RepID=A0ABY4CFJ7_9BACT|nr:hypothetical protein [Bdellovibrio reynosensis]UOF02446.1 hypothetical protein MNR06_05720 [Bdellovibrio reynosensis]
MSSNDLLGWAASLILIATIVNQVRKQIRDRTAEGVSIYLFAGQIVASLGLAVYSYNLGNWVFTVLNLVLLIANITGFYFTRKFKREEGKGN